MIVLLNYSVAVAMMKQAPVVPYLSVARWFSLRSAVDDIDIKCCRTSLHIGLPSSLEVMYSITSSKLQSAI